jgi:hypothetical protein
MVRKSSHLLATCLKTLQAPPVDQWFSLLPGICRKAHPAPQGARWCNRLLVICRLAHFHLELVVPL